MSSLQSSDVFRIRDVIETFSIETEMRQRPSILAYRRDRDRDRHLEFVRIENSVIRSDVPENPTHSITKHEVDRTTDCGDIAT